MIDDSLPQSDASEGAPHPRHAPQIIGQTGAVSQFLQSYTAGKLHHAWLITGPKGIGKATLAWKIAQTLLHHGEAPSAPIEHLGAPEGSSTDRQIQALSHPGLFLIRRKYDEKAGRFAQNIVVDDVRGLRNFFGLSSAGGTHRVVIIDSVDEMNTSAANALLKLLEEPPSHATLLLISHHPSGLLPTIRSRCRTLALRQLVASDLSTIFQACDFDAPEDMYTLTELAMGSAGEAMRLTTLDGVGLYSQVEQFFQNAPQVDRAAAHRIAAQLAVKGAEAQRALFCDMLWRWSLRITKDAIMQLQSGTLDEPVAHKFVPSLEIAPIFMQTAQDTLMRLRTGLTVNLDPASLILDTLLTLAAQAKRS